MKEQNKKIEAHEKMLQKIQEDVKAYQNEIDQLLQELGINDEDLSEELKEKDFSPELWEEMQEKKKQIDALIEKDLQKIQIKNKERSFKNLFERSNWNRI